LAIASSLHLKTYGRLTGISGMFYGVIKGDESLGFYWKYAFIMGLATLPFVFKYAIGNSISMFGTKYDIYDSVETYNSRINIGAWIIGGLLVGFGTRMANGCTSGHVLCGISLFSKRSFTATVIFLIAGVISATLRNQLDFLGKGTKVATEMSKFAEFIAYPLYIVLIAFGIFFFVRFYTAKFAREYLMTYLVGLIYGFGLMISGLCRVSKVIGFLTIGKDWDPTLLFVFLGGVVLNTIAFNLIRR